MLQGDYPTMSIYYPCMKLLLKSLNELHPVFIKVPDSLNIRLKLDHFELNTIAKQVRENLLCDLQENIDTKFTKEQKNLMGISSFLDPRWKSLSFLEEHEREEINMGLYMIYGAYGMVKHILNIY